MKYPNIVLYRYDKYSHIDSFFETNKDNFFFTVTITNDKEELNKLFDVTYHIFITYGDDFHEYAQNIYSIIPPRMNSRWIHLKELHSINELNKMFNYCYINNVTDKHENTRPVFSLFTTCYNSYDKIFRAYNSIKTQILKDWEWVILDDSPDDAHFSFLKATFKNDRRIRLYNRSENSGSIGNVKNEAVLLCRGKYVIEMDHDDEILPDTLLDAANVFDKDPEVGFVYMDFVNLYENGANFSYGDFFGLGYSGYYCQKLNYKWVNVAICPNINNTTLSHIVAVPNHPRIWRKSALLEMGNYSEFLPVSDDYELLLRTAVNTKMVRIPKLSYVQYMNNNNNNFSLIRNSEINRLCKSHLYPQCYEKYKINEKMKELDAFENPIYSYKCSQIWKRDNYEFKYCNKVINVNYKKQYCIIGLDTLRNNKTLLSKLYNDSSNDFLVLDNKCDINELTREIDNLKFDRMKCYKLADSTIDELIKYFHLIYRSCDEYSIIYSKGVFTPTVNNHKKITIITPCIRPENLVKIKESINFDYVNQWLIIYDGTKIKEFPNVVNNNVVNNNVVNINLVNDNIVNTNPIESDGKIKEYIYIGDGISGNPQRNFALDLLETTDTYLYFLDDDNVIHPNLYELLDSIELQKIYTFNQKRPVNIYPYKEVLTGDTVDVYNIDTAMVLIDFDICKDIRWKTDKYNADGYYIKECYENNKDNWIFVDKIMAFYNNLT
jgi:glycosyltransferase involved in cell wall biosynthesis